MSVISSNFQIVVPKEIREKFDLHPGDSVAFVSIGDTLQLAKQRPMKEYEGFLKGMDTHIDRDENEEERF